MGTLIWEPCGRMTIRENGRPKFPAVKAVAGLYRLILDDGWVYIGETGDISHRLWEYEHPTTGVVFEHRIHQALKNAKGAIVEIFTDSNLSDKPTRCTIEASEILSARREGKKVLNGGRDAQSYCLRLDIAYHEKQIARLRENLKSLRTGNEGPAN